MGLFAETTGSSDGAPKKGPLSPGNSPRHVRSREGDEVEIAIEHPRGPLEPVRAVGGED